MSKKLAIRGHVTRGKEVIELLKMMGGTNPFSNNGELMGNKETVCYYICENTTTKYIFWNYIGPKEIDNYKIFTLEEFLEKYPFKVGDKVRVWAQHDDGVLYASYEIQIIESMRWNESLGKVAYKIKGLNREFYAEELKLYKEEVNMEENKVKGYCTKAPEKHNETKKIAWFTFWDNDFADKVELDLKDRELIQENGKWFAIKKKPKYPTNYNECCEVLDFCGDYFLTTYGEDCFINKRGIYEIFQQVDSLTRLLICKSAYWKIAGEELGLGKPWEPDWNEETDKFTISNKCNKIYLNNTAWYAEVLSFPTAEMRDAFYENFKDLIESCKELL